MSRQEVNFWKQLKEYLPGEKERVENMAGEGMPDVSAVWDSHDYWVELKVCTNKIKIVNPTTLCREQQLVWHTRRGRHGTMIFIAVKYTFCIVLYKWVSFEKYEEIIRIKKIGAGYNWDILTRALRIILLARGE
jgi:hypothetical protein